MSSNSQKRRKLKAKRFSKFESSKSTLNLSTEDLTILNRGIKRGLDSTHSNVPKRIRNKSSPTTAPKNLANDRLQKLRECLKRQVQEKSQIDQEIVSKKNISESEYNDKEEHNQVKGNIYKKIHLWGSSSNEHGSEDCIKNLVNERLRKLNKNISKTKENESIVERSSTTTKEINEKHVPSLLRERSKRCMNDGAEPECSQAKKITYNQRPSMINTAGTVQNPICNTSLSLLNDLQDKHSPNSSFEPTVNKLISGRLDKIKNLTSYATPCLNPLELSETTENFSTKNQTDFPSASKNNLNHETPRNKSVSCRLNKFKTNLTTSKEMTKQDNSPTCVTSPHKNFSNPTCFKSFGGSLLNNIQDSDTYRGKMAMTASWIRFHQSENETETPQENLALPIDIDTEEMEWTNAEPDEFDESKEDAKNTEQITKIPDKLKAICVIVDTNIFISNLSKVQEILNIKLQGPLKPIIYIPWMVMTELDYMKDTCSNNRLKNNIDKSVRFINNALKENNSALIGQTVFEAQKQKQIGISPDDKILSCCLQVQEKYETVILLSNDLNLKNKAMINNIPACGANEILMKVMSQLSNNLKYQKIMQKMGILCSSIICECAKQIYGDCWAKMGLLSNAPWSLQECLKRFSKYWQGMFQDRLMKQFTKVVQDFQKFLEENNKYICDDSPEYISFIKMCINLCIFLKDIEEYRGFVENTINDITKIG